MRKNLFVTALLACGMVVASAQSEKSGISTLLPDLPNFRPYDQTGINTFETTKDNDAVYNGMKLKLGAGFTQQFQSLSSSNTANLNGLDATGKVEKNMLYPISNGAMLAQANLFIDVLLADGIRLNVTSYLSSRHHNETWVKGGYIQMDKLPFHTPLLDEIMKYTTIKVGQYEVNYGDAHYRRPDGGHTLQSPFMEGNIMDAWATELGGDIFVQNKGFFGMLGLTTGQLNQNVNTIDSTTANPDKSKQPSLILKGGYDKQLTNDLRVRVSGSWYHNGNAGNHSLTLYGGDRTGSNYQNAMDPYYSSAGTKNGSTSIPFSGRLNPGFSQQIDAGMFNAFIKYQGLEFFGTLETTAGKAQGETNKRNMHQWATELIYRFGVGGPQENLYVGARYNEVTGNLNALNNNVTVDRLCFAGGWFLTKNILMKAEYVVQNYKNFDVNDYRNGGKFDGVVVEAAISF